MNIIELLKEGDESLRYKDNKTCILWGFFISSDFDKPVLCNSKTRTRITSYFSLKELLELEFSVA